METVPNVKLAVPKTSRRVWIVTGISALAVVVLWLFPGVWYSYDDLQQRRLWLVEQTNIVGWQFAELSVAKSAEANLAADCLFSGEYRREPQAVVCAFSAKRYSEKQNEIGLFVHTPDRCWTEAGWKMEPTSPDMLTVRLPGLPTQFERRIFVAGSQRELVYFGGLVGGQPLPYRLDHNLSVGMKYALRAARDTTGTTLRASDSRFWNRVWDSFLSRRPLLGPKQFIRVSTTISGNDIAGADALLQEFLGLWLKPVDYREELRKWRSEVGGRRSEVGGRRSAEE